MGKASRVKIYWFMPHLSGIKPFEMLSNENKAKGFKFWTGMANFNRTACIRHLCRKTIVLSYHRCLINIGAEKMNNI
jgi:hypothetical protein